MRTSTWPSRSRRTASHKKHARTGRRISSSHRTVNGWNSRRSSLIRVQRVQEVQKVLFIRFVLHTSHPTSGTLEGLFALAYRLRDSPSVHEHEREELKAILEWFDQNLKTPKRFNSSRSKGHFRRKTRGIAWFKDTSAECMGRCIG